MSKLGEIFNIGLRMPGSKTESGKGCVHPVINLCTRKFATERNNIFSVLAGCMNFVPCNPGVTDVD